ncbi:MAG: SHOCT domain-containing protein [Candidatus Baltobacteraceae bacterium]
MDISTGYPFLDIFVTIIFVFAWIVYIWIAITVLIDIFRRSDLSGWAKAGWVIAIVVFSWLGVLIYLIANHDGMNERRIQDAKAAQGQLNDYIRTVTGAGGPASEIEKAKALLDSGTISQAQFDAIKAKVLA